MKVSTVVIALSLMSSVALTGFIIKKRPVLDEIIKKTNFMDMKVGITRDVVTEYHSEIEKLQVRHGENEKALKDMDSDAIAGDAEVKNKNAAMEACEKDLKKFGDDAVAIEKELKSSQDQFGKEKAQWTEEIAQLKQQLELKSKVCDFVKTSSVEGRKLCGAPDEPKKEVKKPRKKGK